MRTLRLDSSGVCSRSRRGCWAALALALIEQAVLAVPAAAAPDDAVSAAPVSAAPVPAVSASSSAPPSAPAKPQLQPPPRAAAADDPPPGIFASAGLASYVPRAGVSYSRSGYSTLIQREAAVAGMPPEIAEAVLSVESGGNPQAVGAAGEIGLMQVMPSTARMLGFSGTLQDLAAPEVNVHYGVMYLAAAWHLAGRDLCTAVMKYRAGHGESRFSYLSVDYCLRVRAHLAARGYQAVGPVPNPTFGDVARSGRGVRHAWKGIGGTINLEALNGQLRALTNQVAAQNIRVVR